MTTSPANQASPLVWKQTATSWWPLAASWLLMGIEIPMISAIVARMGNAEGQLAAFGGVVFPLALLIEAPVIMMLTASTALCSDRERIIVLKKFMMWLAAGLTLLHLLIVSTPLWGFIVGDLLDIPVVARGPARLAFLVMLPWTWAIADRRFHQGLLIRANQSNLVGLGTAMRLLFTASVLLIGFSIEKIEGAVLGGAALSLGVIAEAVFARIASRQTLRSAPLKASQDACGGCNFLIVDPERLDCPECGHSLAEVGLIHGKAAPPMNLSRLLAFYVPLALTPLVVMVAQPLGSAGMSRMPLALASLAAWPALNGLVFMIRSLGVAMTEVVVNQWGRPNANRVLGRFTLMIAILTTALIVIVGYTPLTAGWFRYLNHLDDQLASVAEQALRLTPVLVWVSVWTALYQGILVHHHRTRGVTEAVLVMLILTTATLVIGVWMNSVTGISVAIIAFTIGAVGQTAWLRVRAAPFIAKARQNQRDS
ncbi:MAG: hypothetical protein P8J86_00120 [Phycisphaerales bacterium]|nr:hypothetical protein [Phycisphaerales bacterium]